MIFVVIECILALILLYVGIILLFGEHIDNHNKRRYEKELMYIKQIVLNNLEANTEVPKDILRELDKLERKITRPSVYLKTTKLLNKILKKFGVCDED